MSTDPLTTVAACRVANIDRQRMNEIIASGDYPCAPLTVPGKTRLFQMNDLIALFVFARLIEHDWKPKRAGSVACTILQILTEDPEATEATIASAIIAPMFRPANKALPVEQMRIGPLDVLCSMTFNISKVRSILTELIPSQPRFNGEPDFE